MEKEKYKFFVDKKGHCEYSSYKENIFYGKVFSLPRNYSGIRISGYQNSCLNDRFVYTIMKYNSGIAEYAIYHVNGKPTFENFFGIYELELYAKSIFLNFEYKGDIRMNKFLSENGIIELPFFQITETTFESDLFSYDINSSEFEYKFEISEDAK